MKAGFSVESIPPSKSNTFIAVFNYPGLNEITNYPTKHYPIRVGFLVGVWQPKGTKLKQLNNG